LDGINYNIGFYKSANINVLAATTANVLSVIDATLINERPCILYIDDTSHTLYFVRASNTIGTAWGTPVIVTNDYYLPISTDLPRATLSQAYINSSYYAVVTFLDENLKFSIPYFAIALCKQKASLGF
jgi:hypothetical protein